MFLGRIKSGQAYLVAKRNQNPRKIMSEILILIRNQYVAKEMFYRHLK